MHIKLALVFPIVSLSFVLQKECHSWSKVGEDEIQSFSLGCLTMSLNVVLFFNRVSLAVFTTMMNWVDVVWWDSAFRLVLF
jgi:hypothetical protein